MPTLDPAEFGSYDNYVAARVGGVRAARGKSRTRIIGLYAKTDEDEDGGEESITIDEIGQFFNLNAGSLSELPTGLWGHRNWEEMCKMAVFAANEKDASALGLRNKPLSASARAIVNKLLSEEGTQPVGGAAADLSEDPKEEARAETRPPARGAPAGSQGAAKSSPYSLSRRSAKKGGTEADPPSKDGSDEVPGVPPSSTGGGRVSAAPARRL